MRRVHHALRKTWRGYAPLALPLLVLIVIVALEWRGTESFTSHEVTFTDPSSSGLAIMPASCASNPNLFHSELAVVEDANGDAFVSETGQSEYGGWACFGGNPGSPPSAAMCVFTGGSVIYLCATNTTGQSYYFPAKTAAELNAVIDIGSSIPGLQIWGSEVGI